MNKYQKPEWQQYHLLDNATIPPKLRDWLAHPGSFMQRLQQHAEGSRIQVLQQNWQLPEASERHLLSMPFRAYAFIREVLILNADKKWMFARTVFPRSTLTGQHKKLLRLKNRSLGSVLFKDPSMQRSSFEVTCLQPGMKWHEKILQRIEMNVTELWARRSIFKLQDKPLLVTEVFFPDIETL